MKNLILAACILLPFFTACNKPDKKGNGIMISVKSARAWKVFDSQIPPDEPYECWSAGNHSMSVTNFTDTTNTISEGQYLEILTWFKNEDDSTVRIEIVPEGGHEINASIVLSGEKTLPVYAFRIPGLDVANVSFVTAWEGSLGFTLEPGKETWIVLIFNIKEDVSSGELLFRGATLPFTVGDEVSTADV